MKRGSRLASAATVLLALLVLPVSAQQKDKNAPQTGILTRTTTRHEVHRFPFGSSLTVVGAPSGSITIQAWSKSEVEVNADIELRADTEADLSLLAVVNSFTVDEDANHLRVISTGTHDKVFMRRVAKKFPKALMNLPWKIDYLIRVPTMCDLEIDAGRGPVNLSGVEGAISVRAVEAEANLTLTGGTVNVTIGRGTVNVIMGARSWRGSGATIQLATGNLTIELPAGFNAEISADILALGQIENSYIPLAPNERTAFTPRSIRARAGAGGAALTFKVGEGTLRIKKSVAKE